MHVRLDEVGYGARGRDGRLLCLLIGCLGNLIINRSICWKEDKEYEGFS